MPDFSFRSPDIEIMDDLSCEGDAVDQTLHELETINHLLGGNHVTINGLEKLLEGRTGPFRIADVGCGSGEMLRLIHQWAKRKGIKVELIGYDANPFIADFAARHTPKDWMIEYHAEDIFSENFSRHSFDVVVGTLFFHHFSNEQLIYFFRQLKAQASLGLIVNDIHRHWFAYYTIKGLTKVLSRSEMVKNDGPLSVLRAFSRRDLVTILREADIDKYTLRWMWAFRWQVIAMFR